MKNLFNKFKKKPFFLFFLNFIKILMGLRMNDTKQISIELYDAFLAYLIQSSAALNETARALSPDPLQAARVDALKTSLDSAKVLLSKVSHKSMF
jgi:hypothetical protein